MKDLSIIVGFVNEYPQIVFTLRAIAESIGDALNFEIIAVDNWCEEVSVQNRSPDEGHDRLNDKGELQQSRVAGAAKRLPWLRYLRYDEKLSHWNCKRVGVAAADSDTFLYMDAHVIPARDAIAEQFKWYNEFVGRDHVVHLPWTYQILDDRFQTYKLIDERAVGNVTYTLTGYDKAAAEPYEVPCMSACGLMMSRTVLDRLGGWPPELGIYGGGEHFVNFVGAVLGVKKFIKPGRGFFHLGMKRGYHWNWSDYQRNRGIASYLYGGEEYLRRHLDHKYGDKETVKAVIAEGIVGPCAAHRQWVLDHQTEEIDSWLDRWTNSGSI